MPHQPRIIYLDNNATTPIHPVVAERMVECLQQGLVNPASQHRPGRQARRRLEEARERIAALLGATVDSLDADRLVFTSGGTEANNLALFGLTRPGRGQVAVSSLEHPSIASAADQLETSGFPVARIRARTDGTIDLDHLVHLLTAPTQLVSVMAANNETGVEQPLGEISRMCREAGVPLHTDAVQVVGKRRVDFAAMGVTAMTVSAHKFHGPRGIGALLVRSDREVRPTMFGGFQQAGVRPGTESVELAVGMQAALDLWQAEATDRETRIRGLRDQMEARLLAELPDLVIVGRDSARLPHTSNIALPGLDRQAVVMALDLAGVACSTGSACASGSSEPSPVLLAMGLPTPVVNGAIRLSLGAMTTESEIVEACDRMVVVFKDLRRRKGSRISARSSRQDDAKAL